MFKRKFLSLASLTAILASMISISANAEVKRTKLDSMKEVYYIFNNSDGAKHEIGDIDTLLYICDSGDIYSTGDTSILDTIVDETKLDTLYYINKENTYETIEDVNEIGYVAKNGREYSIGNGPLSKNSSVIDSQKQSDKNENDSKNKISNKIGWIEEKGYSREYIGFGTKWTSDKNGTETRWKYKYSDGTEACNQWLKEGEYWYYFDLLGYMEQNNKLIIDGKLCIFDEEGHLREDNYDNQKSKTGWVKDSLSDGQGGIFDWRYIDSNGENHTGWLQENGYWYYFDPCGHMVKFDMRKIDGKIYSFDYSGHLETNLSTERYAHETGLNHTGPEDGSNLLCGGCSYKITSDSNGVCTITPLQDYNVDNLLYKTVSHSTEDCVSHMILFDKNGNQVFGWFEYPIYTWVGPDNNTGYFACTKRWMYFDDKGVQVVGTSKVIDGKSYTFDSNGYLI